MPAFPALACGHSLARLFALSVLSLGAWFATSGCTKSQDSPQGSQHSAPIHRAPPGGTPIPPPPEPLASGRPLPSQALADLPPNPDKEPGWGVQADASGANGVVTSVDATATAAGVETLEAGGNAVDAAVATALALAVTHPSAGNLGGGGFMVVKVGQTVEAIDFREDSPASLTDKEFWKMIKKGGRGGASVGVPGTVAGLFLAHKRHGKLPWASVVAPAHALAVEGYPLGERQAKTIAWAERDLRADPIAREAFFKGGARPKAGTMIKRPRLALALARIRDNGRDGFYLGATAKDLVSSLGEEGLLTIEDLKSYRAQVREPLHFDFHGYRVITMPAPSAGGVALAQTLLMLEASEIAATRTDSAERLHLIAEAGRRAQAERQLFVVSPDELMTHERAELRARALNPQTWLDKHPIDPHKASRSNQLHPAFPRALRELEHTTHLSVIDSEGGLVSLTVTLSGSFGARVLSKETGIVFNNSTASFSSIGVNTPQPGKRTTSSMAPTLVLAGDHLALVLGSPGGDTIPSTVSQTLLRLVLDESSLKEAVNAPRFHQTFAPGDLTMERQKPLPDSLRKSLEKRGHKIATRRSAIGDANIAALVGAQAYAVCDEREGGLARAAGQVKRTAPEKTPTE